MPLLLRTAAEDDMYRRWTACLLNLAMSCVEFGEFEAAHVFFVTAVHFLQLTLEPSRR
jgi:hypothetical protein